MMNSYPKIIFCDLEGTLLLRHYELDNGKVAPSAWTLLAYHLGPDCYREEEESKDKWLSDGYAGYVEWMRDTIRIHQKYGLSREIFDRVMNSVPIVPGAHEAFQEFRSQGAITALISGGFKALGDRVQRELKIDHVFCGCEYFFSGSGNISHFNLLPSDNQGKISFMRLVAEEHGIDPADCAFVGDGMNDAPLVWEMGLTVAFNAQPLLRSIADAVIDQPPGQEDFQEVARLLAKDSHQR